jgi:hypothetical protein
MGDAADTAIPAGDPAIGAWDPMHPDEVARLLDGVSVPWWVAGGWALDLWRGAESRPHHDIEICVPRAEWHAVRDRLAAHDLWYVDGGSLRRLAHDARVPEPHRQVWARDRSTARWRLDAMLDSGSRDEWVCHRDARLRRPLADAVGVTPNGVRYLCPEVVLLLKAKQPRPKDEADFAAGLPRLDEPARRWLRDAVSLLHPGHPWLARISPRAL